jgi:condensin complex subunit 1
LTSLLENHPFLESLNPEPYRNKLQELYDWVKAHFPEAVQSAFDDGVQQLTSEGQEGSEDSAQREEAMLELEQGALAAAIAEAETLLAGGSADPSAAVDVELSPSQQEYCTKVRALQFTQSALEFIAVLEDATTALESMLLSSNTSDVVEALRFFVQARHFDLPCAVTGMKRALALLWSSEQAIRDEVIKSFVEVFIVVPGSETQEPLPDQQITKNLLVLTAQATASERVSIEEAIQRLVASEVIPPNVFLMLWTLSSTGPSDTRAAAVRLLAMGAAADASVVDSKSRLKLLLAAGFGTYARKRRDWRLVEAASICLQRVERAKVDSTDAKYLVLELTLDQLQAVARGDWCNDTQRDTLEWFPAAEQAIKALFNISPAPEVVSRNVILSMYKATFNDPNSVHPLRLARFFHIVGQVSLQLLVYTEALCSRVRRVNAKKSLKRQEEADNAKSHKRSTSGVSNGSDDNNIESELGVAAEVEAENERAMADIAEKEIVGRNLIAQFGPLLARVVANEDGLFGNVQILTQAAMLALVKLMCVSSKFCEDHLTLLFSALANAPPEDTTMRANTVVALGDLAFRFPNEVEPYTPHLYACLRDPSTKVRRHTLMVLTHLILNDMVRVKGQVCEIALCLRDDDPRIRDMSRLLFHELSKRTNNPIYNLLPDIISNLGQVGTTKKEDFRGIMTFLLGFIKKDRQNEMLVDKLCHRFPTSGTTSQKADLAYCIAQLKMTDRTIKCLNDNYKLYKDALHDDDVHKSFVSIVSKAKKKFTSSGETAQLLEDWEAKISDAAIVGAENEDAEGKAVRASQKAGRKQQRKKKVAEFDAIMEGNEEEAAEHDGTPGTPPKGKKKAAPAKRSTRKKRQAKRVVDDDGASDDAVSDDEFEFDAENDVGHSNVRKIHKEATTPKRPSRKAKSSARPRRTAPELSD